MLWFVPPLAMQTTQPMILATKARAVGVAENQLGRIWAAQIITTRYSYGVLKGLHNSLSTHRESEDVRMRINVSEIDMLMRESE